MPRHATPHRRQALHTISASRSRVGEGGVPYYFVKVAEHIYAAELEHCEHLLEILFHHISQISLKPSRRYPANRSNLPSQSKAIHRPVSVRNAPSRAGSQAAAFGNNRCADRNPGLQNQSPWMSGISCFRHVSLLRNRTATEIPEHSSPTCCIGIPGRQENAAWRPIRSCRPLRLCLPFLRSGRARRRTRYVSEGCNSWSL